jgi:hypothetical protein
MTLEYCTGNLTGLEVEFEISKCRESEHDVAFDRSFLFTHIAYRNVGYES